MASPQYAMTLGALIQRINWRDLKPEIVRITGAGRAAQEAYETMFHYLCAAQPEPEDMRIVIQVQDIGGGEGGEQAPVVLGRNGTLKPGEQVEEEYDMSFMPWENWLSMTIDEPTTAEYSDAEIIAHCLDEMTAFSFSPDEIARQLEVIRGLVDEIRNSEG